jgi:ssDNA-binding Zn-finger/Zn-ribbon topoisomerase 1
MGTTPPSDALARIERENELRREFSRLCPECPACERAMKVKEGPHGEFWGCPGYPKCRKTEALSPEFRAKRDEVRKLVGGRRPPFF